ncbi:serine/threonine-protein kinase [Actinophytocola sp.]|uniref:serine/threonine-protein kinase n=1 Tax=Actinophytocola sp. TaxID=1872138 RepID=UPI00389AB506
MGRRELPVTGTGPVEAFAQALRLLRVRAGTPSYRLLSRKAGYSASALSAAASGAALPSLDLALAYAGACGGDPEEWAARWHAAADQAAPPPTPAPPAARPPAARPSVPGEPAPRPPAPPQPAPPQPVSPHPVSPQPVSPAAGLAQPAPPPAGPVFEPLTPEDPARAGRYRLRARIGAGSTGRVYLAYTDAGRAVAVKIVRPELAEDGEFRRRFEREVAAARQVHSLFTAQVLDADVRAARPWLAATYVPGPSLHEAVTRHGPLPVESLWLLVAGIAEALQTVQRAGLVHRDIKPSNVLLAADGPRLIDFGIAHVSDATTITRTGITLGVPQFMAPEHVLGRPLTFAADVFALGSLAAYAATGESPFGSGVDTAVLYRVVHEPPSLGGVPGELRDLVAACLAKEPARRPGLADVIGECRRRSEGTSLRITSGWLPPAHAEEIRRRAAATA